MHIAMWSGPRNLSTAMMYAFAAREDCAVVDEPFYAAFLQASGEVHPMQDAILASQPTDPSAVVANMLSPAPEGKAVFYQKQMSHHMLPEFPTDWIKELANVFLLRHPARVIASYQQKREEPRLEDIGIKQQCELFARVQSLTGLAPVVIDSDDILADPEKGLKALCAAIGLAFDPKMLTWQAGGNAADGVWASHWYASVWSSTGLKPTPIKPLPALPENLEKICQQAMPFYQHLAQYKLVF
ncbi:HAD family hydrolase [Alteromonas pelagimontana]|uniref:HAD family hydrolase n=1 Tax=Alteromonas pelagimontana TaxID=1858656 RepID=A0A6M4MCW4_9ALTE|nr:sulfotransferase family protein [Alteromonas pelagimontana]QJR80688.1 HAD family hydrolase [Alteromonas pelagimontana]